jgi:hypothetical protein
MKSREKIYVSKKIDTEKIIAMRSTANGGDLRNFSSTVIGEDAAVER